MFYKISNIASKEDIENKFDVAFEFPNLYNPQRIIEGLSEATVSVITLSNPEKIKYAIWGLLPEDFEDNWSVFQDLFNTLNVNLDVLQNGNTLYTNALKNRRCVILATGFFTTRLDKGSVKPCLVHLKNHEPFAIAGVFNQLSDGFLTCSIVVTKVSPSFKGIPNISNLKPLVLNDNETSKWLNQSSTLDEIKTMCQEHNSMEFDYELIDSDDAVIAAN